MHFPLEFILPLRFLSNSLLIQQLGKNERQERHQGPAIKIYLPVSPGPLIFHILSQYYRGPGKDTGIFIYNCLSNSYNRARKEIGKCPILEFTVGFTGPSPAYLQQLQFLSLSFHFSVIFEQLLRYQGGYGPNVCPLLADNLSTISNLHIFSYYKRTIIEHLLEIC